MLFWTLLGLDALVALGVVFFFLWGLSDGTVSAFNIGIWMALLGGVAAVLGGGAWLGARGQRWAANLLLAVLALPACGAALMLLVYIINPPRW